MSRRTLSYTLMPRFSPAHFQNSCSALHSYQSPIRPICIYRLIEPASLSFRFTSSISLQLSADGIRLSEEWPCSFRDITKLGFEIDRPAWLFMIPTRRRNLSAWDLRLGKQAVMIPTCSSSLHQRVTLIVVANKSPEGGCTNIVILYAAIPVARSPSAIKQLINIFSWRGRFSVRISWIGIVARAKSINIRIAGFC
jgi:hypothetical protein